MHLPDHGKKLFHKIVLIMMLLLSCNFLAVTNYLKISGIKKGVFIVCAILSIFIFALYPNGKEESKRLAILYGGYRIFSITAWTLSLQILLYIGCFMGKIEIEKSVLLWNGVINGIIIFLLLTSGMLRMIFTSKQLNILLKIIFFFIWYIPVIHIILFYKICHQVKIEYIMEHERCMLQKARKEKEVCSTRYPIIMVHGVFFRDWQYFNYWGRIPKALIQNGATIYYGRQQSAEAVAVSAQELKEQILEILKTTQAEKVNIIAHSKGGLDSRYMISLLNMEDKVASLTTVNTPHLGCTWVDKILNMVPESIFYFIGRRYNSLFTRLGDKKPDFVSAVRDLTADSCKVLDQKMPDSSKVYYQSTMSQMKQAGSAGFPLNFSYLLAKQAGGDNDGLVNTDSAIHGHFLGIVKGTSKRGVSHGDVIDLFREDIQGYDVQEFYVQLVKDLKERGF